MFEPPILRNHQTEMAKNRNMQTKKWIRLLHIYLSLYAFLLLLFFGTTGLMMNHPDWFNLDDVSTQTVEGKMPIDLCKTKDKLAIVEFLRTTYNLKGAVVDCSVDGPSYVVSFRRAGEQADATIDPSTGSISMDIESNTIASKLSAIHTGDQTGRFGRRVIDVTAVFLIVTAASGLLLWTTIPMRRQTGLISIAVGGLLVLFIGWRLLA